MSVSTKPLSISETLARSTWPSPTTEDWKKAPLANFPLDEIFSPSRIQKEGKLKKLESVLFDQIRAYLDQHLPHNIRDNYQFLILEQGKILGQSFDSLPIKIQSVPVTIEERFQDRFYYLNAATATEELKITIPKNTKVATPLILIHLADSNGFIPMPRTKIHLMEQSEISLTEWFLDISYITATQTTLDPSIPGAIAYTEILAESDSRINYYTLQSWSKQCFAIQYLWSHLASRAASNIGLAQLGSRFHKIYAKISLTGKESSAAVHGFALGNQKRYLDSHIDITHSGAHSQSSLTYKSVISGRSFFNFSGSLRMEPEALFSSATQVNKNLLIGGKARVHTTPKLEILVDEVQCSHGATISNVDDEMLFYLAARGIDYATAQGLLIEGFLQDVIDLAPTELSKALATVVMQNDLKQMLNES